MEQASPLKIIELQCMEELNPGKKLNNFFQQNRLNPPIPPAWDNNLCATFSSKKIHPSAPFQLLWNHPSKKPVFKDYSQFAPKPARPPYQLAPLPTRPNQLAPLILPTRPTSTTNSPHVVCQLAQFSDQLAPAFTNSPHFSYQLAPLFLPTRPTFL